jgi:hypothetical protein
MLFVFFDFRVNNVSVLFFLFISGLRPVDRDSACLHEHVYQETYDAERYRSPERVKHVVDMESFYKQRNAIKNNRIDDEREQSE